MKSFKDLENYKLGKKLAIDIHHYSLRLPKYELYETGGQIRRSTKSVVFNIAEGYGRRRYKDEYIRYLIISQASCDEVFSQLEMLLELYPDINAPENIIDNYDKLGRKINKYIQYVEKNWK